MTPPDEPDEPVEMSSPVCYAYEFETPPLSAVELAGFLNVLLESERAGARVLGRWVHEAAPDAGVSADVLGSVRDDEGRFCVGLTEHLKRLGATPSTVTGRFYDKAMTLTAWPDRLRFLDKGQSWVAREIRDKLPRVEDPALVTFLRDMLERHEHNLKLCAPPA
jgi:nitronate monooxygenase